MRILDWAVSLFAAAAIVAHSDPAPVVSNPQEVTVTGYSCQRGYATTTCKHTRWGGDVYGWGAACPESWRGRVLVIEGADVPPLVCDDTAAYETWNGLPLIDIRFPTTADADAWGNQTRFAWEQTP